MLDKMRQLALARLCSELVAGDCADPEAWYRQQRNKQRHLGDAA